MRRAGRGRLTRGPPPLICRTVFCGHSLAALKRGVLAVVGFGPIRETAPGGIETRRDRARILKRMAAMGARAA